MGAGIGKKKKKDESQNFSERRANLIDFRPDVEFVLADATSPEWENSDVFIFSEPNREQWEREKKKQGRFYSRLYRFIGSWKMEQNCLFIRWDTTNKVDIIRAEKTELIFDNPETKMKMLIQDPLVLPEWFAPDCLSRRFERADSSSQNFECEVCFFELWRTKCAALRRYTRRVCEHFVHYDCANYLLLQAQKECGKAEAECPVCGAKYTEIKEVPDLMKDPRGWFQIVDCDFGGSLSRTEVLGALGAVLPIEREKLNQAVEHHWHEWDPDQSGTITCKEFLQPGDGLRDYIMRHLKEMQKIQPLDLSVIPELDTHPSEWFEYWDIDGSGTLELNEIIRAFIRTFCVTNWGEPMFKRAFDMRNLANAVWIDQGFHPMDSVDFQTFIEPNGLADTFLHNQIHSEYFGESGGGF